MPIAIGYGLLLALRLVVVDFDAQKDAPFHHRGHDIAVELAEKFTGGVDVLTNYDVRVIVDDHTVHVIICTDGHATVALEGNLNIIARKHVLSLYLHDPQR